MVNQENSFSTPSKKPPSKGFFGKSVLRREIALLLIVKLMLIFTMKYLFFSNPVPKDQIIDRLDTLYSVESDSLRKAPINVSEGKIQ